MAAKKPAARPKGARPVKKVAKTPPKQAASKRAAGRKTVVSVGAAPDVPDAPAVAPDATTDATTPPGAPSAAPATPTGLPAVTPPIVIPPPGVPLAPLVKIVPAAPVAAPATDEPAAAPPATTARPEPRRRPVKKVARRGPPPKGPTGRRPPAPRGRHRKLPPRWVQRVFAEPNVDGPRVRVAILWFALLAPAVWFGPRPTAALFGFVAVIAALQNGQAWHREGYRPSRLVAAPIALALPIAAIYSYSLPGLILALSPVPALVAAFALPRRRRRTSAFAAAGITLRCALPAGLAAAGMVFLTRLGTAPTIAFVVLLIGYDAGSFIVGAESPSPSRGIIAGGITTMVFVAPMWFLGVAFDLPPFGGSAAWVFGGMVAVFAPLGQIAASLCMPTASTWVPALRRLDSYIVTAPLWTWAMWGYLAS